MFKCSHVPMFKCSNGFTLIELLVSISIIVVVILSAMGIYMYIIGSRQKTLGQLNIQQDGQYIMSLISKDIRAGKVDYVSYSRPCSVTCDGSCSHSCADFNYPKCLEYPEKGESPGQGLKLADIRDDSIKTIYQLANNMVKKCYPDADHCGYITMSQRVSVERLDFYICPRTDPFEAGSTTYKNPRVTIVLKLKSLTEKTGVKELILQQTVPQRYELKK